MKIFFNNFIQFIHKNSKFLFILSIVLFLIFIIFSSKLKLKLDFKDLLDPNSESVKKEKVIKKIFGNNGFFLIGLKDNNDGKDFKKILQFKQLIIKHLEKEKLLELYIDNIKQITISKNPLLYLNFKDIKEIRLRLENAITTEYKNNSLFQIGEKKKSIPFKINDILNKYPQMDQFIRNNYFYDHQNNITYVFLKPNEPATNISFLYKINSSINSQISHLKKQNPQFQDIKVILGGEYYDLYKDRVDIKGDIQKLSLFTILLLSLLLIYFYRNLKSIIILLYPVLFGVTLNLGLTYFIIGQLNLLTGFLSMILLGTGLDFAIHTYNRYLLEKINNDDKKQNIISTFIHSAKPSLYAAITTAIGFYSIALSDFQAFKEFGIIAGNGLVITSISILILLPTFIFLFDNTKGKTGIIKIYHIDPFIKKHHIKLLIIYIVIMCISIPHLNKVQFEYNFATNRTSENQDNQKLTSFFISHLGLPYKSSIVLTQNKENLNTILNHYEKKKESGQLETVHSLITEDYILPKEQDKKIIELKKIKILYQENKDFINKKINKMKYSDTLLKIFNKKITKITTKDVPNTFKYLITPNTPDYYALFISPTKNIFTDSRQQIQHIEEINIKDKNLEGKYEIGGIFFILTSILTSILNNIYNVLFILFIILIAVSFAIFRNIKDIILILINIGTTGVLMFSLMVLLDIKFTFLNVVIVPIIIGISFDSIIHISYQINHEKNISPYGILNKLINPILLSSITTTLGFISLFLAKYNGLVFLAQLATVGIISSLISSLLFTPLFVPLLYKEKK